MAGRPRASTPEAETQLDNVQKQFDSHERQIKDLTLDRMAQAPKQDIEPQTKIAQKDLDRSKDIYLKPKRALGVGVNPKTGEREKFNEKFREDWNFAKEYVHFIAENKEIIGEHIEMWTKPFPGVPCEFWEIPVNKPVWAPRYVAEQLKRKYYHRLKSEDRPVSAEGGVTYTGTIVIDTTIQRLDAMPVSTRKSVFMGSAANF